MSERTWFNNEGLVTGQEYAKSMARAHIVGNLAVRGALESDEAIGDLRQLRAEFDTTIAEMLRTDPNKGKNAEITRFDEYPVRNGQVISYDGRTPVVSLVHTGYLTSKAAMVGDERLRTQNRRDYYDWQLAKRVDAMVCDPTSPNTIIAASLFVEEAVERDGEEFWKNLNYYTDRKTAFLQIYHRRADGSLLTGTLSVDGSNKHLWRQLWARRGQAVPEDASTDEWVQYAFDQDMPTHEVEAFGRDVRREYYDLSDQRRPVGEDIEKLVRRGQALVDHTFKTMYISLTESLAAGRKTPLIAALARGLSEKLDAFNAEVRHGLMRVSNRENFDDHDARLMHQLILYGLVEKLRAGQTMVRPLAGRGIEDWFVGDYAGGIVNGALAGREYGACGWLLKVAAIDALGGQPAGDNEEASPQEAFGGKGKLQKMTCPFCGDKDQRGDPCSPNQHCTTCDARVVDGKVVSKGDGGRAKSENQAGQHATEAKVISLLERLRFNPAQEDNQTTTKGDDNGSGSDQ